MTDYLYPAIVTASRGLNQRKTPGGQKAGKALPPGTEVVVTATEGAWWKCYLVSELTGKEPRFFWCHSYYLKKLGTGAGKPDWGITADKEQGFKFLFWPTEFKKVTQPFLANSQNYIPFGLPGHEGIDLKAPHRSKIFTVASGVVVRTGDERLSKSDGGHNYGVRIYIDHAQGFQTVYAHLDSRFVNVGDSVTAGQVIGLADNTGNSRGSHLHLTLKHAEAYPGGKTYIGFPWNIIDPTPYLKELEPQAFQ